MIFVNFQLFSISSAFLTFSLFSFFFISSNTFCAYIFCFLRISYCFYNTAYSLKLVLTNLATFDLVFCFSNSSFNASFSFYFFISICFLIFDLIKLAQCSRSLICTFLKQLSVRVKMISAFYFSYLKSLILPLMYFYIRIAASFCVIISLRYYKRFK